ncbi:hypothetical protein B7435_17000 [Mycolicibacterium peregrinum]|nr:hypothetical protein B7435_17000 [Mycolicibacterium peregrinum]
MIAPGYDIFGCGPSEYELMTAVPQRGGPRSCAVRHAGKAGAAVRSGATEVLGDERSAARKFMSDPADTLQR